MITITFEKVSSKKDAQTAVTQNIVNATAKGFSPLAATGVGKDTMEFETYNNTWTGAKFNGFISAEFLDVGYKSKSVRLVCVICKREELRKVGIVYSYNLSLIS